MLNENRSCHDYMIFSGIIILVNTSLIAFFDIRTEIHKKMRYIESFSTCSYNKAESVGVAIASFSYVSKSHMFRCRN